MNVTVDRAIFSEGELSQLSRKSLQPNVLEYQLRAMFDREGFRPMDVRVLCELVKDIGVVLSISGPAYTPGLEPESYSPFIREWQNIYTNYLEGPFRQTFVNGMVQMRFVTFNPLSIYYQLLLEEQRLNVDVEEMQPIGRMRRMIPFKPRRAPYVYTTPIGEKRPLGKVSAEPLVYRQMQREYDGHFAIERTETDMLIPGNGTWAEGIVDDDVSSEITFQPELDFPRGAIFNMFMEYPFYAFPLKNVFKKIEDLNRMIESGMCVVFVEEVPEMELYKVKLKYEEFFQSWGIPLVDYVDPERLKLAGIRFFIPSTASLPRFFVIRRPLERFHSAAWAGMNTVRRRGLPGIPWASSETSGSLLVSPQPDDGFLAFVKEGVGKRIRGIEDMDVRFPLCTLHTQSEIQTKILSPLQKVLGRDLGWGETAGICTTRLRGIGEWVLLRGLMRKHL